MFSVVHTADAPAPIGPYSQALKAGGWLFCSGQVALGPTGNEPLPEDLTQQAHKVMQNLKAVLSNAGGSFSNVIKTSIFLRDMADFAIVNDVYASYLTEPFPARETVAVSGLPRNAKVEISCIAYLGS